MIISKKKLSAAAVVLLIVAVSLVQTTKAYSVDTTNATAKDKLPVFLSEVIGLDFTKYNVTNQGYSVSYPSNYGGLVKDEVISFTLESSSSKISVMGIFDNGFIYGIIFRPIDGSVIYSQQPSTNVLKESENIIQKYQTFAKNYGIDTSHLTPALSILNSVTDLTTSSIISGNTKLEISSLILSLPNSTINQTSFAWIYTANGVDVPNKCLRIDFDGNVIAFKDTWGLYSVGSFGVLSKDEATSVAWAAAKDYNLTMTDENNVSTIVKPDWSNMTSTIDLNMIPGQTYNNSLNNALNFASMGNTTRNPLTLYPLWQTIFYFSKHIGDAVGIQVGVWGDTKEIAYVSEYGFLGDTGESAAPTSQPSESPFQSTQAATSSSPASSQQPTPSVDTSNPLKNPKPFNIYLILGIVTAIIAAIALATVIIKKRGK